MKIRTLPEGAKTLEEIDDPEGLQIATKTIVEMGVEVGVFLFSDHEEIVLNIPAETSAVQVAEIVAKLYEGDEFHTMKFQFLRHEEWLGGDWYFFKLGEDAYN